MLSDTLINEIGEYLGFKMWNNRDKSLNYDFPGAREDDAIAGEDFVVGSEFEYKGMLFLSFKQAGQFHAVKSLYTLNLRTLKPTRNSPITKLLSPQLCMKIKYN